MEKIAVATVISLGDILLHKFTAGAIKRKDVVEALELAEGDVLSTNSKENILRAEFSKLLANTRERRDSRVVIAIDNLDRCRPRPR